MGKTAEADTKVQLEEAQAVVEALQEKLKGFKEAALIKEAAVKEANKILSDARAYAARAKKALEAAKQQEHKCALEVARAKKEQQAKLDEDNKHVDEGKKKLDKAVQSAAEVESEKT